MVARSNAYPRNSASEQKVLVDPETGETFIVSAGLDELGRELPDDVPFAPAVPVGRGLTMAEQIREMIERGISRRAQEMGWETWEEANDFDIEDDPLMPRTMYEDDGANPAGPLPAEAPLPPNAPPPKAPPPPTDGVTVKGSPPTPPPNASPEAPSGPKSP